uniref:Uncharacterized protein n=1 Tax=Rousettus aegyptiacus TaxID=9407 RepID=A0A7J8EKC6_ROUAE|nr:hypothetical protein HJG63_012509 [Rousettus aegyptiacus]
MFDFYLIYFSRVAQRELKRAKTLNRKILLAPSDPHGLEKQCLFYLGVRLPFPQDISGKCCLIELTPRHFLLHPPTAELHTFQRTRKTPATRHLFDLPGSHAPPGIRGLLNETLESGKVYTDFAWETSGQRVPQVIYQN